MILSLFENAPTSASQAVDGNSQWQKGWWTRRAATLSNEKGTSRSTRWWGATNELSSAAFIGSLLICTSSPLCSHALSMLDPAVAADMPNFAVPAVTPPDAARLLLDSSPSTPLPSKRAMKELEKQRNIQDFRLSLCQETGSNFDQCFFYGTKNAKIGAEFAPSMAPNPEQHEKLHLHSGPSPHPIPLSPGKSKIPTW